jgi:hypothetical protein
MPGDGSDVDESEPLAGDAQRGSSEVDGTEGVDADHLHRIAHLRADTGGVDDRPHVPASAGLPEEAGDGLAVGDVADECARFDAILGQCGRSRVETRLIEIGQNDAVVGAEEPRGGESHATCAAGDDRGLRHGQTPLQT